MPPLWIVLAIAAWLALGWLAAINPSLRPLLYHSCGKCRRVRWLVAVTGGLWSVGYAVMLNERRV